MPRVSVRNSVRNPISPRAGTRYSIRTQPVPWLTICSRRPLRSASSCVTTPTYSSGMSIARRSTGSWSLPSISRVRTCGWPTVSSKPSRRMISTRIASWSSPRPWTSHVSGRSVGCTRIDTLPTSSASRRFLTWRAVTFEPSRPASGEVLMPIVTARDGSSTWVTGSGLRVGGIGDRLADRDLRDPRDGDDVARAGPVGLHAIERLGDVELGEPKALDLPVGAAPRDLLPAGDLAVADPAQREATDVRGGVEVGHERLERVLGVVARRRDPLDQQVQQRLRGRCPPRPPASRPSPPWRWCRRSGTRSAPRRRRGRGTARRPRR